MMRLRFDLADLLAVAGVLVAVCVIGMTAPAHAGVVSRTVVLPPPPQPIVPNITACGGIRYVCVPSLTGNFSAEAEVDEGGVVIIFILNTTNSSCQTPPVVPIIPNGTTNGTKNCTRSQGYWKTHSVYGNKHRDDTWDLILPDAEDTPFFSCGCSWYGVLVHHPSPYFNLGRQYVAATLNFLMGSFQPPNVVQAYNNATLLFQTHTAEQGEKDALTKAEKDYWEQLKNILEAYNLIHCPDDNGEDDKNEPNDD